MIKGSLVPNITIFDSTGEIDRTKTEWHMQGMFSHGVNGLFLTGSYGAGPLMSVAERIRIFESARRVADAVGGERTLIAHVGAIDTGATIELATEAERIGVDGVAAVPPFYYKHSDEVVLSFYKELIDAVRVPVYAYNNPATSRYTFSLPVVRELAAYGLRGLKDSPLNVAFLSTLAYENRIAGGSLEIILGTSTGWLPLHHMGVNAAIAGMNNWAPEIMTELFRATFERDWQRAEKAYTVMMDLSRKMHFTDSTIASHMGLYARGFDAGVPRKPMLLPPFDDARYDRIRKWIRSGFDTLGLELENGSFVPQS